jgi:carboxyl-terminal processing protease
MKRVWLPAVFVLVPILAATVFMATVARAEESDKKDTPPKDDYYTLMKVFVDTFQQVERNYVKDVDRRELLQAAIEGMMSKLDPYSSYISPEEMAQFSETVDQEFGGIGIHIYPDERTHRLMVVSPLPGTPAYRAGMLAGDAILEIDGKSTEGYTPGTS